MPSTAFNKNNSNLDLIRERLNILDVVSTYIKLDKSGNQFRARCPFHNEKSPSFYVSPSRGSYHCFGCNEHGDIFGFVMKIEGINFKDALKILADKAGVSLNNFKKEETSNLIDILEAATIFFEKNFSQNLEAKDYLKQRGLSAEYIQKFRIGFAPNDWRQLYNLLNKAGYSDEEIVSSGLCIKHEKGLYDRFRSRIMFPIMNASGKVVAFSGRIIGIDEGKEGVAKYVNSPETQMYHKSSILFGYNFAKQEIAKQKKVLVVEGQMDVCMAHMAGNSNTVAISGTAFTPEHISILKRFSDTIILALDTDKAGYNAMLKSAALALANDIEVEGILLTDKDPADTIKHDINTWKKIISETKPILTIVTEIILKKENIKPKQMQLLRKDLFPLLRVVKSPLLKQAFIEDISNILKIDKQIILEETNSVDTQIEIPKKRETKRVNVDMIHIVTNSLAYLKVLEDESLKKKYSDILYKYLNVANLSLDNIPEDILNKEIFLVERNLENKDVNEKKLHIRNTVIYCVQKILENQISVLKVKIKLGENLEENLREIQNLTKDLLNLKNEIN